MAAPVAQGCLESSLSAEATHRKVAARVPLQAVLQPQRLGGTDAVEYVAPTAPRRRTGERRTNLHRSGRVAARPREAVVQEDSYSTSYHRETGGVQRGQMSMNTIQLPPLALFASFSGLRKKMPFEGN